METSAPVPQWLTSSKRARFIRSGARPVALVLAVLAARTADFAPVQAIALIAVLVAVVNLGEFIAETIDGHRIEPLGWALLELALPVSGALVAVLAGDWLFAGLLAGIARGMGGI